MSKVFTATIHDPHSIALYDAQSGAYEGVIYITSGTIIGMPIVTPKSVSVQFTENGLRKICPTIYFLLRKTKLFPIGTRTPPLS